MSKNGQSKQQMQFYIYLVIILCCVISLAAIQKKDSSINHQEEKEEFLLTKQLDDKKQLEKILVNESICDKILEVNQTVQSQKEIHGVYYSASKVSSVEKAWHIIQQIQGTKINAVVIDVKNDSGKITFQMDHEVAKKANTITNEIVNIQEIIEKFHQHGIYVIGRVVAFRDASFAKANRDYALKRKDGSLFVDSAGDVWLNPYNKQCWKYLVKIGTQAAKVGFDEIQFDYVRFPTQANENNVDFGVNIMDYPKTQVITEFIKYAVEMLHLYRVKVSADVFGTIINSKSDGAIVGQDYVEMSKYLDYICPMIYPSHYGDGCYGLDVPDLQPYALINQVLGDSIQVLNQMDPTQHCAIVRPWLQDFTASWKKRYQIYGKQQVNDQIRGVSDAGYSQWLLWNSSGKYSELR